MVFMVFYLAWRDVESAGAKVYFLPLVNEGQDKDNTRTLWGTNSTQAKHNYSLIVRHSLQTRSELVMIIVNNSVHESKRRREDFNIL